MTRACAGGCHCGAIGFRYTPTAAPPDWSVRACQCSFCRAHAALSTSDPDGRLEFVAAEPQHLQRYRFARRTADFLICRRCGVYIGALIVADDGARYGIINTRALAEVRPDMAAARAIRYDGEDTEGRLARRVARWTPVTSWPSD